MKIEQLSKESIVALQIHNEDVNKGIYSILVYDRVNNELYQQNTPLDHPNDMLIDLLKMTEIMNMFTVNSNTSSKSIFTRGELSRKDVCNMITDVEKYLTFIEFTTRQGVVKEYSTMTPFIRHYKSENVNYSKATKQYGYTVIFVWHNIEINEQITNVFLEYGMRFVHGEKMNAAIDFDKIQLREIYIHLYEVE